MPINPQEAGLDSFYEGRLKEAGCKTFSLQYLNALLATGSILTQNYKASLRLVDASDVDLPVVPRRSRFTMPQALGLLYLADSTDSEVIVGKSPRRRRVNQWEKNKIIATTRAQTRVVVEDRVDFSPKHDGSAVGIDTLYFAVSGPGFIFFAGIQH